jgi:tellurite resistance protein TerC
VDLLFSFLASDFLGTPAWLWLSFLGIVFTLLAFDLGVLNRSDKELGIAESLKLSVFYIAVAIAFGAWVWWSMGAESGMQYFTGYAIEKALSIDNVFVISLIFGYFAIPPRYQYRALVWGIVAVLVLRGFMIAIGAALVQEYDWVLLLFGPSWSPRVSRCCSSAKASRTSRRTRWCASCRAACGSRPSSTANASSSASPTP